MAAQERFIPLTLQLRTDEFNKKVDEAARYADEKFNKVAAPGEGVAKRQPQSARERAESRAVKSMTGADGRISGRELAELKQIQAVLNDIHATLRAIEKIKPFSGGGRAPAADAHVREFKAMQREAAQAAREVERINAQTRRQAEQQVQLRARAAKTLADVQIREAKRAADEFVKSEHLKTRASEQSARSSSISFSRLLGGAFFANLGARAVSSFIGEIQRLPEEGTRLAAEAQKAFISASSKAAQFGRSEEETRRTIENLKLVKLNMVSAADAAVAYRNVLARFTPEQAVTLLDRFADSLAFGKREAISYGEALKAGTQGLKNLESQTVDNLGFGKNLDTMMREHGMRLQDLDEKGKKTAATQALYNSLLKETAADVGNADRFAGTYSGTIAAQDVAYQNLLRSIGQIIITHPAVIKSSQIVTRQYQYETDAINDTNSASNKFANDTVVVWSKIKANLIPAGAFLVQFVKGVYQVLLVTGSALAVAITRTFEGFINGLIDFVKTGLNIVIAGINKITSTARLLPTDPTAGPIGVLQAIPEIKDFETGKRPSFLGSDQAKRDFNSANAGLSATLREMNRIENERLRNVKDIDDSIRKEAQMRRDALDELQGTLPKGAYKPAADAATADRLRRAQAVIDELSGASGGSNRRSKLSPIDREDNEFFNSISRNLRAPRPADPRLTDLISRTAAQFNIPQGLAFAQLYAESSFNPKIVSGAGAIGIGQVMPATGARFGFTRQDLKDPKKNLTAWGQYMMFLYNRFGDWDLAVLAYHQGEGRVDELVKVLRPTEGGRRDVQAAARASGVIGPVGREYLRKVSRYDRENSTGRDVPFNKDLSQGLFEVLSEASPQQFAAARSQFFSSRNREGMQAVARATMARQPLTSDGRIQTTGLALRQTRAQMSRDEIDAEYFGRWEQQANGAYERVGGLYEELITRRTNLDQEYQNQWRDAFLEREHREMDYVTGIGRAEAELHELRVENMNETSVANRRLLLVKSEELDLTKRLQDLQDEYATTGANAALRQEIALQGELNELKRADYEAVESQIRSRVRLADATVVHSEQVRARVLEHLADQTTATEAYSSTITGAYDAVLGYVDRGIEKITKGVSFLENTLKSITRMLLNKLFVKLLDALVPPGSTGGQFAFAGNQQTSGVGIGGALRNLLTGGGNAQGSFTGGFSGSGGANDIIRNLVGGGGSRSLVDINSLGPLPTLTAASAAALPSVTGGGGIFPAVTASLQGINPASLPVSLGGTAGASASGLFGGLGASLAPVLPFLGAGLGAQVGARGGLLGSLAGGAGGLLLGGAGAVGLLGGAGASVFGAGGALAGLGGAAALLTNPFTIAAGAALLVGSYFYGKKKQRQRDETERDQLKGDAFQQIDELLKQVKSDRLDGSSAITQAVQIKEQYFSFVGQLKTGSVKKSAENYRAFFDAKINQIRLEADAQLQRQTLDRSLVPEFATGGVVGGRRAERHRFLSEYQRAGEGDYPLIKVKAGEVVLPPHEQARLITRGGIIPGIDRGVDDTFMRAPRGTAILNKEQQREVREFAAGGFVGHGRRLLGAGYGPGVLGSSAFLASLVAMSSPSNGAVTITAAPSSQGNTVMLAPRGAAVATKSQYSRMPNFSPTPTAVPAPGTQAPRQGEGDTNIHIYMAQDPETLEFKVLKVMRSPAGREMHVEVHKSEVSRGGFNG